MIIQDMADLGYTITDPWDAVLTFEHELATYAGADHCVVVDSCSSALFLCLRYLKITDQVIEIPGRTYSSVPMQIIHAGNKIRFTDQTWDGSYHLSDTGIVDAATQFYTGMYEPNTLMCTSFHHRKILKLGRGGCIFTDDPDFVSWCRPMIYDGRDMYTMYSKDQFSCIGYHMYMTPEDAVKGLTLLHDLPEHNENTGGSDTYNDLRSQEVFHEYLA